MSIDASQSAYGEGIALARVRNDPHIIRAIWFDKWGKKRTEDIHQVRLTL